MNEYFLTYSLIWIIKLISLVLKLLNLIWFKENTIIKKLKKKKSILFYLRSILLLLEHYFPTRVYL